MTSFGIIDDFFSLIYPRLCVGCNERNIEKKEFLCLSCQFQMPYTDHFENQDNGVVNHLYGRFPIVHGGAVVYYSKDGIVQKMVHRLKYKRAAEIGVLFGRYASQKITDSTFFKNIDVIIPVPIHFSKKIQRGYNQAHQFGLGIAQNSKIPTYDDVLIKILETSSQTKKSRDERIANVSNSLAVKNKSQIRDKHILLVDDVITTGATLEACGKILLKNGASRISVLSLALAI